MSYKLLLPNKYKRIGWFILIPTILFWIFLSVTNVEIPWLNAKVFSIFPGNYSEQGFFRFTEVNPLNTIVGVLFIAGALLVGFSKEKNEDEFISNLRLTSLLWAVLVNYILLLIAFLFIYNDPFLAVMIYNMFTVLLFFIIRFNYILYKTSKSGSDEK